MNAYEWNLLKSATEKIDRGRAALNEERTATALVELDATVRRLLRQPQTAQERQREEAAS